MSTRTATRRLLSLLALAALVPGAAQARDTTVATVERPSEVRELDGIVVYSAFDPAIDAYRLTVRDAEGVRALPVAPSAEPFEADIGTNSSGDPQVVFSVDVGPVAGGQAGGRDLFVMALDEGAARPVRNANTDQDEVSPTIDDGRIAFTRVYPQDEGTGDDKPIVYTKRLVAPRERPSTRLSGVPTSRGGSTTQERVVLELELEAGRLGQVVRFTCGSVECSDFTYEVRQVELEERSSRRVATLRAGINGQFFVGLSFAEGYLAWYETSNLGNGSAGAYRYRPGRAYRFAEGPPFLSGFAWTGEGTWQARASYGQLQDDCDDGRTTTVEQCTLVRTDDLDWEIVAADRVR
jgi:hypothetical protein